MWTVLVSIPLYCGKVSWVYLEIWYSTQRFPVLWMWDGFVEFWQSQSFINLIGDLHRWHTQARCDPRRCVTRLRFLRPWGLQCGHVLFHLAGAIPFGEYILSKLQQEARQRKNNGYASETTRAQPCASTIKINYLPLPCCSTLFKMYALLCSPVSMATYKSCYWKPTGMTFLFLILLNCNTSEQQGAVFLTYMRA